MRLLLKSLLLLTIFLSPAFANADEIFEPTKTLPEKIGAFRAQGSPSVTPRSPEEELSDHTMGATIARAYSSATGNKFLVYVTRTVTDSGAYALLTRARVSDQQIKLRDVGTAGIAGPQAAFFFKGNAFVRVVPFDSKIPDGKVSGSAEITVLARGVAEQLDGGQNDLPVLVKHLPDWEKVQPQASYAVSLDGLKGLLPNQPVLDSVSFEGGAEAVMANYDSGSLLIIEFNTAKIAGDNDWNIRTKINELRSPNQPAGTAVPTAYRRVGNYSVFVFDTTNEQAANQLIDQVKYQQVVQWLGENPYLYEDAQREFVETTLGVFVAVVKSSGLALLTCFAVGGIFGGLLFIRRRAQQRAVEAYSDAGGMLRLNIDEMTPKTDTARLLRPGN